MTDSTPTIAHGDEYVVLYSGGPYDGQTDRRIATEANWDSTLTVLAAIDGKETMENYDATGWKELDGTYHVTYLWDKAESEPSEDPEDRGDRQ